MDCACKHHYFRVRLGRSRDREQLLGWQKLVTRAPADEVLAAVRSGSR